MVEKVVVAYLKALCQHLDARHKDNTRHPRQDNWVPAAFKHSFTMVWNL
jgi:hypothetical protein